MVLAEAEGLGTQQAQRPQVVQALVTVEMRTALQVTAHIIAVVAAVAAVVEAIPGTEGTAGGGGLSFPL